MYDLVMQEATAFYEQRERELGGRRIGAVRVEAARRLAIERRRDELDLAADRIGEDVGERDRPRAIGRRGHAMHRELRRKLGAARARRERAGDELVVGPYQVLRDLSDAAPIRPRRVS